WSPWAVGMPARSFRASGTRTGSSTTRPVRASRRSARSVTRFAPVWSSSSPSSPADLGDHVSRGPAGADEGGRSGSGPVAVAEQVQPGLADGAGALGGDEPVGTPQAQRCQMAERGPEPGAPQDDVAGQFAAIGPG